MVVIIKQYTISRKHYIRAQPHKIKLTGKNVMKYELTSNFILL